MNHKDGIPPRGALRFRKSTFSGNDGGCVDVAFIDGSVVVRDSKDPTGPVLTFTADEWDAFLAGVRASEFDIR